MATETTTHPDTEAGSSTGLKRNAIGLLGAMMVGVIILSPSIGIYFNWGFMIPSAGVATSLVFLIALLMALPTGYGYALISGQMPSAGTTYKWGAHLISPRVGIAIGLCTTIFYACLIPANVPFIALMVTDLLRSTSTLVFALVMGGSILLAIPFVYRGVTFNIEASAFLVALEVLILVVTAVVAFATSSDSSISAAPLNPSHLPSGGLLPALILGVLAFTGFDAVSTVAEETRLARRLIPRATIFALVGVGLFWLFASFILSNTLPADVYGQALESGELPLAAAANLAFGAAGRDVIDIMGIEASFAVLIAASIGSTRILYAMGRDGVIHHRFGTVHPKFQVPWTAISAILGFAVIADLALSIYLEIGFVITSWMANLGVFFALVTYLFINLCNLVLFGRHRREHFHWLRNGLIPLAGLAVTGYFLYKGFFAELLAAPEFKTGGAIVITALALLAAAFVAAMVIGRKPEVREAAARLDQGATADEQVPG
ncbi:MAG: APC family permease [Actinobacteria bacterium]|nr:APC family permease [Actinomycetota bacterium]